ncbi:MAG TPA: alpha-2-macroglobulin family protein, partial [Flavobacteriaceae bacterium]|nr:alpha-2-macroglobulin family protein [Flavobacteriaceae bacterium]
YSGSVNNIFEIGGDDVAESGKKNKANRFKPVAKFLGPFYLKPGETQQHQVEMPNYIGSVRTMLIAGDATKAAYGKVEKTTPVKKPLMVLASLPRKLSPGETVDLPVTVFNMNENIKNVKVNVSTTDAFKAIEGNSKTIQFDQPDEKLINFRYNLIPTDEVQKVVVEVSGNGEKASYEVEIDVENPNPYSHKITDLTIDKNGKQNISYSPFGVPGTNDVKLELSTLPPMNLTKLLKYLEHYPHSCVEQSTSTAFPLLFLDEVVDLSSGKKASIKRDIKSVIQKTGDAQLTNGSLPFWPGQSRTNEWVTSYAGHFMLEAKEKGYALPLSFLNSWLRYQKNQARQWNIHAYSHNTSLTQAYRLYTLALAGQPELAAMNRLRESNHMTNEAKWRLAAAYAMAGKKQVAKDIASTANTDFSSYRYDYFNYGSPIRNQAMALETMVILEDEQQRELAVSLAKKMNERDWMNTQETSYTLLSMAKMLRKSGGKDLDLSITQDGKTQTVKTKNALAEIDLNADDKENTVEIVNHNDNVVHVSLYQEGQPELGQEVPDRRHLKLKTTFVDGEGEVLDVAKIRQGTEVEAKISVTNTSNNNVKVVALTQVFPSGWEIVNTRFTESKTSGVSGEADYTDIRDDRVHFYFDLESKKTRTFKVKLNASYLGKYYLPGTFAEGMYDRDYYAQEKGKWIEVHQ